MKTASTGWRAPALDRQHNAITDYATLKTRWLGSLRSPETARKYGPYLETFCTWMHLSQGLTEDQVVELTIHAHLEDYVAYLQQPHADDHPGPHFEECWKVPFKPASVNAKVRAVGSFFKYCMKHTSRAVNPVSGLDLPNTRAKDRRIYLPGEINALMAVALREEIRDAVMVGLFMGMGLRCSDAANAQAADYKVFEGNRRLLGTVRKGDKWQLLDVPFPLVPLFDEYHDGRDAGPFLRPYDGRRDEETIPRLSPSTLFRALQRVGEKSGFPSIGTHDGKATATTLASTDPNSTPDRVMRYFGHEDYNTTLGYIQTAQLKAPGHHVNPIGVDWSIQAR